MLQYSQFNSYLQTRCCGSISCCVGMCCGAVAKCASYGECGAVARCASYGECGAVARCASYGECGAVAIGVRLCSVMLQ